MAQIPLGYLNSVVSLGEGSGDQFSPRGTGFLYGHRASDGTTRLYLVTNKHVVEKSPIDSVRLNLGSGFQVCDLGALATLPRWQTHPSADVAVVPGNTAGPLMTDRDVSKLDLFVQDASAISPADAKNITEGDGVFLFGFPLGLVGTSRNDTIVRRGCIARIQDWHRRDETTFLIDAAVFPGNSGGPVVIQAEALSITGTPTIGKACLIGMISSYIPYSDVAVSQQTGEARIAFVENSGLAIVVPIQIIQEFIESCYPYRSIEGE